jgi:hypothetical protein
LEWLGDFKPTISQHASHSTLEIDKAIGRFGVGILPKAHVLVSFSGGVDMVIIKLDAFQLVLVLMALSIVSLQTENLVGFGYAVREDDRKIQGVEQALSHDYPKLSPLGGVDVKFPFSMSPLGAWKKTFLVVLGQRLGQ